MPWIATVMNGLWSLPAAIASLFGAAIIDCPGTADVCSRYRDKMSAALRGHDASCACRGETALASHDHFRQELRAQMALAASGGASHVQIDTGELHYGMGIAPLPASDIVCRDVMRAEMQSGDTLVTTIGGMSIRYVLPRAASHAPRYNPADEQYGPDRGAIV